MGFGEQLRAAREARRESASEVAAATRMKVQTVKALEDEDLRQIAAPIYGRGFIRLYAEHVGLEVQPLIDAYMEKVAARRKQGPGLAAMPAVLSRPAEPPVQRPPAAGEEPVKDLFEPAPAAAPAQERPDPAAAVSSAARSVLGGISGAARRAGEAYAGAVSTVAAGAVGLKSGRLRMTPSRAAAALLGAVVLAVLVISLAVRAAGCSRTDADAAPAVSEADNGRLIIVREPPAPYAD